MQRRRLAIIFHRFGPYHWARLRAAAECFDLLAIEESAETAEYAWDKVVGDGGFQRTTLFAAGESEAAHRDQMARRMEAELERARPELVAIPGWSNPGGLAALRWALRRQVPTILMSESTANDRARAGWKEWIKRRIVALCGAGLVGGAPHREYLAALGMAPERIFAGYDVVDNAHFQTGADAARQRDGARAALGLPDTYFLASSRFLPQKNLFFLLAAYASYHRKAGDEAWKLVLLGDGPLKAEIMARSAELELGDALVLPGFKQYAELPAYYGLAGAFVHAATSEPWGLVVNEAVAAGLPVIVSERCGCARDLVEAGRNGHSFNPSSPADLADFLLEMSAASDEARSQMGRASREIAARWPVERFAAGLEQAAECAVGAACPAATWLDQAILSRLTHG